MREERSAGIVMYHVNKLNKREYLILKHDNHWDFPKGKIERGETLEETAQRELLEETGLTTTLISGFKEIINYIFIDKKNIKVHKQVTFFIGTTINTNVQLSHEHTDYRWLTFDEALEYVTYENARQLLIKADKFIGNK